MQSSVIISRATATARVNELRAEEILEDFEVITPNAIDEQRRFANFWVGVQKSIQLKQKNPKSGRQKDHSRFGKSDEGNNTGTVFMPDGEWKIVWDTLVCCFIVYSVIVIPFRIGFDAPITVGYRIFDYFVDIVFFMDMAITFNTAYLDATNERFVQDHQAIAVRYIKCWFWIDLFSTMPFDSMFVAERLGTHVSSIRLLRMLRLMRMFKLSRLVNMDERLEKSFKISPAVTGILILMTQIFFCAHLFACIWHFITLPEANQTSLGMPPRTWVSTFGYEDSSLYARYVASLYFTIVTMLTVGYGDIRATNEMERFFAMIAMLTGGMVFGALISKVAKTIDGRNPKAAALKANMNELKAFMEEIQLPSALRLKTKDAYAYYLKKKSTFGEKGIFSELPESLLYRLVFQIYKSDFDAVKLLSTHDASFVVDLVIHSRPFQAVKDEIVFAEGDVCNDIVLISRGSVKITTADGVREVLCGVVQDGGYFGDFEYYRNTTAIATYTAIKHCDLLAVSHKVFDKVVSESFDSGEQFQEAIKQRYNAFIGLSQLPVGAEIKEGGGAQDPSLEMKGGSFNQKLRQKMAGTQSFAASLRIPGTRQYSHISKSNRLLAVTRMHKARSLHVRGAGSLFSDGEIWDSERTKHFIQTKLRHSTQDQDAAVQAIRVVFYLPGHRPKVREMDPIYLDKRGILHPLGKLKLKWDLFVGVIIIYCVLIVPVEIAFSRPAFPDSEKVHLAIDAIFLVDMCASFRTAYMSKTDDALVVQRKFIAYHYFTNWFLVDLLSTVPFDLIVQTAVGSGATLEVTKLLKIVRLLRLFELVRLMKLSLYIEDLEDKFGISPVVFDIVKLLVEVFFIAHWVACVWWGVCNLMETPMTWYREPAMVYENMTNAATHSQYLISLYWTFTTMTTVGYGDILPVGSQEQLLNIFIILLGVSVFGYIIANVSGLIDNFNEADSKRRERFQEISEYLHEQECSDDLQRKIVGHFKNVFHESSAFDVDRILSRLPHTVSNDILMVQHRKKMSNIAIFAHITNPTVCLYLFQLMTPIFFERDKYVLREGKEATDVLFLVSGKASAYKKVEEKKKAPKSNIVDNMVRVPSVRRPSSRTIYHFNSVKAQVVNMAAPSDSLNSFELTMQQGEGGRSKQLVYDLSPNQDDNLQQESKFDGGEFSGSRQEISELDDEEDEGFAPLESFFPLGHFPRAEKKHKRLEAVRAAMPSLRTVLTRSAAMTINTINYVPVVGLLKATDDLGDIEQFEVAAKRHANIEDEMEAERSTVGSEEDDRSSDSSDDDSVAPVVPFNNTFFSRGCRYLAGKCSQAEQAMEVIIEEQTRPFHQWTHQEMSSKQYAHIGHIYPGDFIGHIGMMNRAPHQGTVRAIEPCIVYALSKTEISKLLKKEPAVALILQNALVEATKTQSEVLGKFHMRKQRAEFIRKDVKAEFYSHHGKTAPEYHSRDHHHHKHHHQNGVASKSLSSANRTMFERDTSTQSPKTLKTTSTQSCATKPSSFFRRMTRSFSSSAAETDVLASRLTAHKLRSLHKKVRHVERVLADSRVIYDSDEQPVEVASKRPSGFKRARSSAIEGVNKASSSNRGNNNIPSSVSFNHKCSGKSLNDSPMPFDEVSDRRISSAQYNPLEENTANNSGPPRNNSKNKNTIRQRSVKFSTLVRSLSVRNGKIGTKTATKTMERRRGFSCPDLTTLTVALEMELMELQQRGRSNNMTGGITGARMTEARRHRRQSFPSLGNIVWKEERIHQGIV